jgi:Ran GTPase-activating protein (RanGAP) involved in mRNA processing and transport
MEDVLINTRIWNEIEISDCEGNVDAIIGYLLAHDRVKELKLNGERIQQCFVELGSNTTSLKHLRITRNWTPAILAHLTKALTENKHLETLDFRWSVFQGESIKTLSSGLEQNSNIKNLHFQGCGLEDEHISHIVTALQGHPALECLELNGNKCQSLPIAPRSSNLKKLDMGSQKSTSERRVDVSALIQALHSNTSLKCIKLAENNLNDEDAENLAAALAENDSLEELYLARNKITDEGIIKLAAQFSKMKGLKKLSIWGNPFGEEAGAKALLEGLKHNVELQDLELFRNYSVSSPILHHTRINRGGRKILKSDSNKIPLALWAHVLGRVNHLSFPRHDDTAARSEVLFHLLRGPALFARGQPSA